MTEWASAELGFDNTQLCAPFLESLPVTGASVSLFGGSMQETLIYATDAVSARLDELQFDLGEGPRWEALRTRLPVLLPNLQASDHRLWPVFGKAVAGTGAAAMFVFPLSVGAIDIGVVELYKSSPWVLNSSDQMTASVLAVQTSWTLLRQLLTLGAFDGEDQASGSSPLSRREIHQATGMVLAQATMTAVQALLLLRAHAFANGSTLAETAKDVVARELDFSPPEEAMNGHGLE
ncbi:GAF and ANTAR domain-containing protein [Arthrobacter sp. H5]|uniref:GAF and ANTAR domain-containing protein n=1 Tax=Arthrobacter sp. H5 TaxID=1267973 RepID=UPI000686E65A|nr:GAF and ANTAR domain-containing protein [Arthrobacter sp. H5]